MLLLDVEREKNIISWSKKEDDVEGTQIDLLITRNDKVNIFSKFFCAGGNLFTFKPVFSHKLKPL